jgi:hypothetical protein
VKIFASQGAPQVSMTLVANLPPVSTTPATKLPLVSMTFAANFTTSFNSVANTCGKFATGVNDTGGKPTGTIIRLMATKKNLSIC